MIKSCKPSRSNLDRYLNDRQYQFASCTEAACTYKMSRARFIRIASINFLLTCAQHPQHVIFSTLLYPAYSLISSITFSAGIYIVLAGVRMLINEIVPAFKGISEKLVPNAKPALDCPIVFPFAPNAVLIGFFCSFLGGCLAMVLLALMGNAGLAVAIILPGAVLHFFCGATAGVCGNATGGLKGCVLGAFVHGIIATFLAAGLYPVLGQMGFANTTFSDTDFTLVGIVFGNLVKVLSGSGMTVLVAILFLIPVVYNYTIGRKASN